MRYETYDEKNCTYIEPEEVFMARDSFPEKHIDNYWQEGIDDMLTQQVDIVID